MYDDIIKFIEDYKSVDYYRIKSNIRKIRKQKGLTPKFFETTIDMNTNSYHTLENLAYKYKPSLESLLRVCYAMDIELKDLL